MCYCLVQSQWSIQFWFQTNYSSGDLKARLKSVQKKNGFVYLFYCLQFSSLQEFTRSSRSRRRYWARSYAGWRRFAAAQPGPAHTALASLERAGRIDCIITQNVDR